MQEEIKGNEDWYKREIVELEVNLRKRKDAEISSRKHVLILTGCGCLVLWSFLRWNRASLGD